MPLQESCANYEKVFTYAVGAVVIKPCYSLKTQEISNGRSGRWIARVVLGEEVSP
jgi:hypothetical protein